MARIPGPPGARHHRLWVRPRLRVCWQRCLAVHLQWISVHGGSPTPGDTGGRFFTGFHEMLKRPFKTFMIPYRFALSPLLN